MRWLVTGATGRLGTYVLRHLAGRIGGRAPTVTGWSQSFDGTLFGADVRRVDLAEIGALDDAFRKAAPDAVLHLAIVRGDPHADVAAVESLAALAASAAAPLVFTSSDMVFDGEAAPYAEGAVPCPLSAYGRAKAEAEERVQRWAGHAVARMPLMYGPALLPKNASFFDEQLGALRQGREVRLFEDEWRTPLHLADAAAALVAMVTERLQGLYHLGGPERLSRLEMGHRLARAYGVSPASIRPARRAEHPGPRPRDLSMSSARWRRALPATPWRTMDDALPDLPDGWPPAGA